MNTGSLWRRLLESGGLYVFVLSLPLITLWTVDPAFLGGIFQHNLSPRIFFAPSDLGIVAIIASSLLAQRNAQLGMTVEFVAPMLGLVGLAVLTAPFALAPDLAWYTALRWSLTVAVFIMLAWRGIVPEKVLKVLVTGFGVQALIGVGQCLAGRPLGLPGELALTIEHPLAPLITAANGAVWLRAYGLTTNPNVLAGFLTVGILAALPLLQQRWLCLVWWLLWLGVVVTFSRSAWLTLLVTAPTAIGWTAWRHPQLRSALRRAGIGAGVIVLLAATLFAGPVATRLQPQRSAVERGSLTSRGDLVMTALGAIYERPLNGVGAGNFPVLMHLNNPGQLLTHAHNVTLQLATEVGVFGGAIWLWMWLSVALTLWRRRQDLSPMAIAAGHAWLAIGLISLFDAYFWVLGSGRLLSVLILVILSQSWALPSTDAR